MKEDDWPTIEEDEVPNCWGLIKLEGYCFRDMEYRRCSGKFYYTLEGEPVENPYYDPEVIIPSKPDYCTGIPGYNCLENDCDYFSYCEFIEEINELSIYDDE